MPKPSSKVSSRSSKNHQAPWRLGPGTQAGPLGPGPGTRARRFLLDLPDTFDDGFKALICLLLMHVLVVLSFASLCFQRDNVLYRARNVLVASWELPVHFIKIFLIFFLGTLHIGKAIFDLVIAALFLPNQ